MTTAPESWTFENGGVTLDVPSPPYYGLACGATAVEGAGAIHTYLEHGFIRAEVVGYEELVALGGMNDAKAKGKLRLEVKEYPVKDGDIVHVRFNI